MSRPKPSLARRHRQASPCRRPRPIRVTLEQLEARVVPVTTGPDPFMVNYAGAMAPTISFSADQSVVTIQNSEKTLALARPVVSAWNYNPLGNIFWVDRTGSDQN